MSKKTRYFIISEAIDIDMIDQLIISKEEYLRQIKRLDQELINTKDYECPLEKNEKSTEFEEYFETIIWYTTGCYNLLLVKQECKEGYRFKNKGEK